MQLNNELAILAQSSLIFIEFIKINETKYYSIKGYYSDLILHKSQQNILLRIIYDDM